jgi:hypothetical protein
MQGEKTTCLSQHKATLMLFRSCSLETSDQWLDLLLEANIGHNTCKADTQEQLRTIHQSRKGFKRGQGLALGP